MVLVTKSTVSMVYAAVPGVDPPPLSPPAFAPISRYIKPADVFAPLLSDVFAPLSTSALIKYSPAST